ncbi:MAG: hypothetical protein R2748_06795 [Bryobacterales bacterium]
MVAAIWLTLRKLEKLSPRALLAGQALQGERLGGDERRTAAATGRAGVLRSRGLLVGAGWGAEGAAQAGSFFGAAALLLGALAWFRSMLLAPSRQPLGGGGALWAGRPQRRALPHSKRALGCTLVASAAFIIVVVALMRHDVTSQSPTATRATAVSASSRPPTCRSIRISSTG